MVMDGDHARRKYADKAITHVSCGVVLILGTTGGKCLSGLRTRRVLLYWLIVLVNCLSLISIRELLRFPLPPLNQ